MGFEFNDETAIFFNVDFYYLKFCREYVVCLDFWISNYIENVKVGVWRVFFG